MPTKPTRVGPSGAPGRPDDEATLTRRARRDQLIEVTIGLVAERGYAGVSLGGIAERAGITKAAVLYHFRSKDEVVGAAYEHVLGALTGEVAAAVEAAPPADGPAAYARSMIEHLHAHPRHTRMIIEALTHTGHDPAGGPDTEVGPGTAARWGPLAEIIETARRARGLPPGRDNRTTALIIGGAIDAIVNEQVHDPDYDTGAATRQLLALVEHGLLGA